MIDTVTMINDFCNSATVLEDREFYACYVCTCKVPYSRTQTIKHVDFHNEKSFSSL